MFAGSRDHFWACSHLFLIDSLRINASALLLLRGAGNVPNLDLPCVCNFALLPQKLTFPTPPPPTLLFPFLQNKNPKKDEDHLLEHSFVLYIFERITFAT